MKNSFEYIFIAGSSGGHILPAIKAINELSKLKDRTKILFVTNIIGKKFINKILNKNIEVKVLETSNKIIFLFKVLSNFSLLFAINKNLKLIGFGGFITSPILYTAKFFSMLLFKSHKIFLHEQNFIFGYANKINYWLADKIFISFPTNKIKKKEIFIGNFFRDKITKPSQTNDGQVKILLIGGSAGSVELNELLLNELSKIEKSSVGKIQLDIQISSIHFETMKAKYIELTQNVRFFSFLDNINFTDYDLVISRSGSGSMHEILYFTDKIFFKPHLFSRDQHQKYNLAYFQKNLILPPTLSIPLQKKIQSAYYFNELINPYSMQKLVCYITR